MRGFVILPRLLAENDFRTQRQKSEYEEWHGGLQMMLIKSNLPHAPNTTGVQIKRFAKLQFPLPKLPIHVKGRPIYFTGSKL